MNGSSLDGKGLDGRRLNWSRLDWCRLDRSRLDRNGPNGRLDRSRPDGRRLGGSGLDRSWLSRGRLDRSKSRRFGFDLLGSRLPVHHSFCVLALLWGRLWRLASHAKCISSPIRFNLSSCTLRVARAALPVKFLPVIQHSLGPLGILGISYLLATRQFCGIGGLINITVDVRMGRCSNRRK
jgi:hypothetical protein